MKTIEDHTHHRAGSAGDDCVECHMPKIAQELGDVNVRSHTFAFVTPSMTDAYQIPNPCTSCHADKVDGLGTAGVEDMGECIAVAPDTHPLNGPLSLEAQRREFAQRRGLAMPLAGAVAWTIVGVGGVFLRPGLEVWVLFGATGSILYLGMFFSRFTGENLLDRRRPTNAFDGLFLRTVGEAVLVYAIAIPFFRADYTSLPLSVGILSGLMWLPLSWIIEHWIGTFHTLVRTTLVTASWYLFPRDRFVAVPAVIVAVYAVTMVVIEARWRRTRRA